jgi:hypothetical protein
MPRSTRRDRCTDVAEIVQCGEPPSWPKDVIAGHHPQLERAVAEAMRMLKSTLCVANCKFVSASTISR